MKALATFALALMAMLASAQEPAQEQEQPKNNEFALNAQLFTRGEWRDGGVAIENNMDDMRAFVQSRLRLTTSYRHKFIDAKVAIQHTGLWGQTGKGNFNLYEAWLRLQSKQGLFVKLGRQELVYDDQRIIGNDDWTMAAQSHDMLKLGLDNPVHKLHLIVAYNQNPTQGGTFYSNGAEPYKNMQTLWYHYAAPRFPFEGSLLAMNVGTQHGDESKYDTQYQQLVGAYIKFSPGRWLIEGSYYRQMGHEENALPIHAWMASVKVSNTISKQWQAYAGYDILSGDDNFFVPPKGAIGMAQKKEVRGFNLLFGSHHQFYGAMDFFYLKAYYGGNTPGLQNLYGGVTWAPINPLKFNAAYHYFATHVRVEGYSHSLGHELELTAAYTPLPSLKISASYTFMRGTKTMEALKRSDENRRLHWAWLSVSYTPQFVKTRW